MKDGLKSGVCPRCDGTEIYSTERDIHKIVPHEFRDGIGNFGSCPSPIVDNFVCGNCGYAEFYVRPLGLETVKKNWDRRETK